MTRDTAAWAPAETTERSQRKQHRQRESTAMDQFAEVASLANNELAQDEYQQQQEELDTGKKRKADDGQPQQRAKRNRYISIACNEVGRSKHACQAWTSTNARHV